VVGSSKESCQEALRRCDRRLPAQYHSLFLMPQSFARSDKSYRLVLDRQEKITASKKENRIGEGNLGLERG